MRYDLGLQAFDMIDQVFVHLNLRGTSEALGAHPEPVLAVTTTMPGVGETDPREWVRDALVAILEEL